MKMLFPLSPSSSKFFTVPRVTIDVQLGEGQNLTYLVSLFQLLASKRSSKHSVITQNFGSVRRISDILIVQV